MADTTEILHEPGCIIEVNNDREYSLENVISKLPPQGKENQGENIRLERALFAQDDKSPILRRAMRLVSEEEWQEKRFRDKQPPYLFLPLVKKKKYKKRLVSLQNKDLFLPKYVDLKQWFSEIKNQEKMPTCTAHAGIALMEYFQNRINGSSNKNPNSIYGNLSWRFLYKVTRKLMEEEKSLDFLKSTKGLTIRDTLKAMVLFGVPPEECWSNSGDLEEEPSAFSYSYSQNYQASYYFRLDRPELIKKNVVPQIRIALASGFPSIFEFPKPNSLYKYAEKEDIEKQNLTEGTNNKKKLIQIEVDKQIDIDKTKKPKKGTEAKEKNSHALVAVGYDDNMEFNNPDSSQEPLKGAFLVRNSWGEAWGNKGYGWLPYYYVEQGLATNWWSLLNAEWIDFVKLGLVVSSNGTLNLSCCQRDAPGCPEQNACPSPPSPPSQ